MECLVLRDERLDVLYGEADASTRQRVQEHLAVCETCREEMAALGSLRQDLRSWTVPAGVAGAKEGLPQRVRRALPMAAALLVGLGGAALGLSGSEVRYEEGRLSFHLGRPATADYQALLAEQEGRALQREQRLRDELRALRSAAPVGGPADPEGLLSRVEQMIHDSEARQAQQMEARLVRLDQRSEAQRRYDLARVAASLAYLDGRNGQQVARTTELMGYMLEASHNNKR